MFKRPVTMRDELILAEALSLSIAALEILPDEARPESDIADMKAILAHVNPRYRDLAASNTQRRFAQIAWNVRTKPPSA